MLNDGSDTFIVAVSVLNVVKRTRTSNEPNDTKKETYQLIWNFLFHIELIKNTSFEREWKTDTAFNFSQRGTPQSRAKTFTKRFLGEIAGIYYIRQTLINIRCTQSKNAVKKFFVSNLTPFDREFNGGQEYVCLAFS